MAISCRFFLMIGCILCSVAFNTVKAQKFSEAQLEVKQVIDNLFEAMRTGNGETLQQCFHQDARLYTIINQYGIGTLAEEEVKEFIEAVALPKEEIWNEVIWTYEIQVEGPMASAWTEYSFFILSEGENQLVHCGYNSFELFKGSTGWLITQITDTRNTSECRDY